MYQPLADLLRPQTLDEVYGQEHILGKGAVLRRLPAESTPMPFFTVTRNEGSVSFACALDEEDQIFGLGETVRGINKRGHLYCSWNMDDFSHTESKGGLYASHNLLLFSGK